MKDRINLTSRDDLTHRSIIPNVCLNGIHIGIEKDRGMSDSTNSTVSDNSTDVRSLGSEFFNDCGSEKSRCTCYEDLFSIPAIHHFLATALIFQFWEYV